MYIHDITTAARGLPQGGTPAFVSWATDLGEQIDRDGIDSVDEHLCSLGRRSRQLDVAVVAAGVLEDRQAPPVARIRAFSVVVAAIVKVSPATDLVPAAA